MWNYLNTKEFDGRLMLIAGYLANKIQGKVILDLNCGHAHLLSYIPCTFQKYIANDIDRDVINALANRWGYTFLEQPDDAMPSLIAGVDILLSLGYAAKLNEHESQTLDETIKALVQKHRPEIVVLECAQRICANALELCRWIQKQDYGLRDFALYESHVARLVDAAYTMRKRRIMILERVD